MAGDTYLIRALLSSFLFSAPHRIKWMNEWVYNFMAIHSILWLYADFEFKWIFNGKRFTFVARKLFTRYPSCFIPFIVLASSFAAVDEKEKGEERAWNSNEEAIIITIKCEMCHKEREQDEEEVEFQFTIHHHPSLALFCEWTTTIYERVQPMPLTAWEEFSSNETHDDDDEGKYLIRENFDLIATVSARCIWTELNGNSTMEPRRSVAGKVGHSVLPHTKAAHKIPHGSMKIFNWSVKIKFNSNFFLLSPFSFVLPPLTSLAVCIVLSRTGEEHIEHLTKATRETEKFIGILLMKFILNSARSKLYFSPQDARASREEICSIFSHSTFIASASAVRRKETKSDGIKRERKKVFLFTRHFMLMRWWHCELFFSRFLPLVLACSTRA
jgi:2-oxo-4-hydroxy-4-carboxy--5-ureidoimidazoline (OHCU) decarboxylase